MLMILITHVCSCFPKRIFTSCFFASLPVLLTGSLHNTGSCYLEKSRLPLVGGEKVAPSPQAHSIIHIKVKK
uniref:Uncharacterized protein n=1 Tax=Anguilla anguilla TaxID=7936 RepID=A0A0E9W5B4_ANGAN